MQKFNALSLLVVIQRNRKAGNNANVKEMHLHFLDHRCRISCTYLREVRLRIFHFLSNTHLYEVGSLLLGIEKSCNLTRSSEGV